MNILFYNCLISPLLQLRGAIKSCHRKVHIVSKLQDWGEKHLKSPCIFILQSGIKNHSFESLLT